MSKYELYDKTCRNYDNGRCAAGVDIFAGLLQVHLKKKLKVFISSRFYCDTIGFIILNMFISSKTMRKLKRYCQIKYIQQQQRKYTDIGKEYSTQSFLFYLTLSKVLNIYLQNFYVVLCPF